MIKIIEIQNIDNCNSKCVMCPRDVVYKSGNRFSINMVSERINEAMMAGLIVKDLSVIFGLHGEPLLDKHIAGMIAVLKNNIGFNCVVYTNALLLSEWIDDGYFTDKKIDELVISNYGDTLEKFNSTTQLNISQEKFDEMKAAIEAAKKIMNVRIWDAWREDGKLYDFSTRAGMVKRIAITKEAKGCAWNRLDYLHIAYNGDLILCCQDWKHEEVFGNIYDSSLVEILNSGRYKDLVAKVKGEKKSDLLFICKRCRFNKAWNEKAE